ncbi:MAG: hypothetical protein ACREPH_13725 [Rhodanobacteraceae bacterium]
MMQLQGLLEKSGDADVLREMIGFASQRLMEMEVEARTGAGKAASVLTSDPAPVKEDLAAGATFRPWVPTSDRR